MDGPVISFDVSKGESHVRAFESSSRALGKVFRIAHDNVGYAKVEEAYEMLKTKTGREPSVVYEFTGVYALPLLSFFVDRGWKVYQISPLESAKMRKAEVRPTKNDSLDTNTIAKVFYSRELRQFKAQDSVYDDLREMSRQYQYELEQSVVEKNRYHRYLDAVWPLFDEVIAYDSEASLAIVKNYGHPMNIKTRKGLLSVLEKVSCRRCGKEELADKVMDYVRNHNSGCKQDSALAKNTQVMAERVKESLERRKEALQELIKTASMLPEFEIIKTIPSVADLSAVRLLSEIGDIRKFRSAKSLIAYAGLDPMVLQSGKQTGEHLHITKKGNAWLRTTLYLIVVNMCRCKPDSKVAKYVLVKKNGGLPYKAAKIAGCNKLAHIVFSMLTNGTCYSED